MGVKVENAVQFFFPSTPWLCFGHNLAIPYLNLMRSYVQIVSGSV